MQLRAAAQVRLTKRVEWATPLLLYVMHHVNVANVQRVAQYQYSVLYQSMLMLATTTKNTLIERNVHITIQRDLHAQSSNVLNGHIELQIAFLCAAAKTYGKFRYN